jgi:hypothetical protein
MCGLTDFISHSASVLQLQFLYQVALANKTKGKTILDIGSRLGAVLYTVSVKVLLQASRAFELGH